MKEHVYPRRWETNQYLCYFEQTAPTSKLEFVNAKLPETQRAIFMNYTTIEEDIAWVEANRRETFDHLQVKEHPITETVKTAEKNLRKFIDKHCGSQFMLPWRESLEPIADALAVALAELEVKP